MKRVRLPSRSCRLQPARRPRHNPRGVRASDVIAAAFADHEPRTPSAPSGPASSETPSEASALNLYLHGLCALFIYAGQRAERPDSR